MQKTQTAAGMKAISLFSGAGGMDLGVDAAKFRTICSIEMDKHCVDTLRTNSVGRRHKTIIHSNIRTVAPSALMRGFGMKKGDLALLYGGPPCQPFSPIGKRLGMGDDRGDLIFEMVRFARAFQPAAVMIEQVPGIWREQNGGVVAHLVEEFRKIGFNGFSYGILDAANFGVAQHRKRFLFVATRNGFGLLSWKKPQKLLAVGDVIGDLPLPKHPDEMADIPNHLDVTPARDRERIDVVPEGLWLGKLSDVPVSLRRGLTPKDSTKYRRLARNLPSNTLRCGEIFYHPTESRYLTPREYMRIHGFDDSYVLRGPIRRRTGTVPNLDQHRQVANSVPPPLAKAVATHIREAVCQ